MKLSRYINSNFQRRKTFSNKNELIAQQTCAPLIFYINISLVWNSSAESSFYLSYRVVSNLSPIEAEQDRETAFVLDNLFWNRQRSRKTCKVAVLAVNVHCTFIQTTNFIEFYSLSWLEDNILNQTRWFYRYCKKQKKWNFEMSQNICSIMLKNNCKSLKMTRNGNICVQIIWRAYKYLQMS